MIFYVCSRSNDSFVIASAHMSITTEEPALLLLVINMNAVLKKQTKLFAKRSLGRWSLVLHVLFQTRNYREVDMSITLGAARKYTDAKSDYKNHVKRCLTLKCSISQRTINHMSDHKSLRLFRFMNRDVMRTVAVVGWDGMPQTSTNRYHATGLYALPYFLEGLLHTVAGRI